MSFNLLDVEYQGPLGGLCKHIGLGLVIIVHNDHIYFGSHNKCIKNLLPTGPTEAEY